MGKFDNMDIFSEIGIALMLLGIFIFIVSAIYFWITLMFGPESLLIKAFALSIGLFIIGLAFLFAGVNREFPNC